MIYTHLYVTILRKAKEPMEDYSAVKWSELRQETVEDKNTIQ